MFTLIKRLRCTETKTVWKFTFCFSVDSQQKEDILCNLCLNNNKKVIATHYCKTCAGPEPLCEQCAKQHARQKACKDHKLSGNIRKFVEHYTNKRYINHSLSYKWFNIWLFCWLTIYVYNMNKIENEELCCNSCSMKPCKNW